MSTLTGNKISLTYKSLIKTSDNDVLTGALKELSDGLGNNSGVFLNTGGDLKSTGTLEFSNFKATAYAVTINKLVNEADGISNNDNDTSLPTSAAVKDYVDTHVTSQDLDFSDGTNVGAVDLDSQVLAIVGTSNEIETSASGQQLQIGLPNDVTISGTYTGTTFSGDLNGTINTATTAVTQTAGDNSTKVATTAYVDTLDAASDLDFSDGSVNSAVNLNTQVLSIQGTSNEITTTASGQSLTIALDSTGVDLPDGSTAITQTAGDNSTKVATTAYVDVLDAASDLDIAGDTGTGDVNLNTQTLTLQGTTNQVITAVSGQTTTFSLPSTVHRDLQGNVTGNADTATAWQTARDLSISGEATGTLSSVDGTSNISGAVTLTNSAVTGKVLTGLPTPAASTVQASDSILEGIGKLQSQINGIANGLQFQGTWDAATNTPTLNSGGGEVDSGTTTGQTADKLIDSTQNFLTTVSVGDKVINQVDGQSALVTNVDSNTSLTLDADIMLSGEAYTIDASPFLVQGHYYVVSVGGTTSLNGNANWAVGDWVIAGADNIWSKLDHTQIDGQGTPGNLPVWNTATTLTDSIVSESGTALTVTGSLSTTLGASVTGDFAVNTNKFTVNATTGDTVIAGNSTFAGTIASGNIAITNSGNGELSLTRTSGATVKNIAQSARGQIGTSSNHELQLITNSTSRLTISNSGNATFAGNVLLNGYLSVEGTTGNTGSATDRWIGGDGTSGTWFYNVPTGSSHLFGINNSNVLTLNGTGATFAGSISAVGASTFNLGEGIFTKAVNTSNSISASNVWGYGLYEGASRIGEFSMVRDGSSSVYVGTSFTGQKLILGTAAKVTALTIDASQNSTFAGEVTLSAETQYLNFKKASTSDVIASIISQTDAGTGGKLRFLTKRNGDTQLDALVIDDNQKVGIGTSSPNYKLEVRTSSDNRAIQAVNSTTTGTNWGFQGGAFGSGATKNIGLQVTAEGASTNYAALFEGGNVGIGDSSPDYKLVVAQSNVTEPTGVDSNTSILIKNNTWSGMTLLATSDTGSFITFGDNNAGFAGRIQYTHSNDNMVFETAAAERMRITNDGSINIGSRRAALPSTWGYSSSYKTLILGSSGTNYQTTAVTLAFGVDNSGNSSASFTGNGRELLFRNDAIFKTPNSANNAYFEPLGFNEGRVGINNIDPTVRLEVGKNDSEVEALSVRYSTVPAYISSSFDGSYALSTFSTNQYNTSDGSASWGSMSNASYGTASVQIAANTAGGELRFFTAPGANQDPTQRVLITSDGELKIGSSTGAVARLHIESTAKDRKTFIEGNASNQGSSSKTVIVNHYPVVSSGNQLIIPFTSQGNLNSTTIIKIFGHSARFNSNDPRAFEATIQVGHLNSLFNVSALSSSGNISGVSTSGMNVIISFTTAYTNPSLSDGIYATIEYMTNNLSYSLQPNNIVMN